MNDLWIRTAVALLFAGVLWAQAPRAAGMPFRQRAFRCAAGAALCLAGYNALVASGGASGPLQTALIVAGGALLLAAIVMLIISLTGSEMRARGDRIRAMASEERKQIDERLEKRRAERRK